jgi:alcohol dehydrogenase (cytochrome c)
MRLQKTITGVRPVSGLWLRRLGPISILALLAGVALSTSARSQVRDFVPVTDAMLQRPDAADWIHWRRTSDGWGYSPLDRITRKNVARLQLVWSATSPTGTGPETPLVHDGVMYWPTATGIRSLDGATGQLLWDYQSGGESRGAPANAESFGIARRSIAIYGDKIFAGTSDAHLIALDARTGALVWRQRVADSKLGYRYTSGPIIARGKVVAGMTGCERYKNDVCFISAHDPQTGKELWRAATVVRPGEAGGDSWGDLPLMMRAGADAWIPGSYDPAANVIFWSTAQAKPWAIAQRGTDGAALYTNSTLAIDAATGRINWYFQHIPAETHDLDEVFESILVDNGDRRSVFKMGKIGVLWELDRRTGKFLNAHDIGYQNVVTINPKTGQGMLRPERIPKIGVPVEYCPGPGGLKNLYAMAYHPGTRAFYIPLKISCARSVFNAMTDPAAVGGGGVGPSKRDFERHPASPDNIGDFVAMDSRTGKVLWRRRNRLPYNTAALTTAGDLVFVGDITGRFVAMDAETGQVLWEAVTPTASDGFPITYAVGGRQYLVVPSGPGWNLGWNQTRDFFPEISRPKPSGTGIHVYELPEG